MLNTAIIGISGWGRIHYEDLLRRRERGDIRICAATVINQAEEAEKCAFLRSIGCRIFDSHQAMLSEFGGKLDLCFIPTGIDLHAPMAIEARRRGQECVYRKTGGGGHRGHRRHAGGGTGNRETCMGRFSNSLPAGGPANESALPFAGIRCDPADSRHRAGSADGFLLPAEPVGGKAQKEWCVDSGQPLQQCPCPLSSPRAAVCGGSRGNTGIQERQSAAFPGESQSGMRGQRLHSGCFRTGNPRLFPCFAYAGKTQRPPNCDRPGSMVPSNGLSPGPLTVSAKNA